MKKITLALLTLVSINLSAQDYFQHEVNYIIDVTLDDERHTLTGTAHIDYTNNSPNDLDFLWFHIWPNAYKYNTTALAKQKLEDGNTSLYYATKQERGFINGLNFKVDGKVVRWDYDTEYETGRLVFEIDNNCIPDNTTPQAGFPMTMQLMPRRASFPRHS